jgi:predicted metal-dependent phosphoesterase TrpH
MIRLDCHTHTRTSWDSLIHYRRFVADVVAAGLDAVAITDHNSQEGLRRMRDLDPPFRIVPGVEVVTESGEILALFVEELPPPYRSVDYTVRFIKERGGVVVLPHLFTPLATERLRPPGLWRALELADAVETVNARNQSPLADEMARRLAVHYGKAMTAGSDAHLPGCLGNGHLLMEPFTDAADFLDKLPRAETILRRRSSFLANFGSVMRAIVERGRFGLPPPGALPRDALGE